MTYTSDRQGNIYGKRGSKLKLVPKNNGYLHFSRSAGAGNPQQTLVHRFVWEYFNGTVPVGFCIDHIDGDRHNNCIDNLQILTQKQNTRKDGNKIDAHIAAIIKERRLLGESGASLSREFGISQQLVCDILKERVWHN